MKVLQIAACIFCIWLVLGRQETSVRLLTQPPRFCPENADCCFGTYDDAPLKKALEPVIRSSDVYANNMEGTTIYVLSAPYWTEPQAYQVKKKLWKVAAGFFETSDVEVRLIDEQTSNRLRWQTFVGILGLLLLAAAAQRRLRGKAST